MIIGIDDDKGRSEEDIAQVLREYDDELNGLLKRHNTTFIDIFNERLRQSFDDAAAQSDPDFEGIFTKVLDDVVEEVYTVHLGTLCGMDTGARLFKERLANHKQVFAS